MRPDIIIGGPPCQDFSSAGKRNEDLGRGDLSIVFSEIVTSVLPQWFVIENVELFRKSNKYKEARQIFKAAGYGLSENYILVILFFESPIEYKVPNANVYWALMTTNYVKHLIVC